MKKLFTLCIILVYGLASTGATVCLDYCCGKLADVSLTSPEKEDCSASCLSAKGCCDSKHVILKVKGEQEMVAKWIGTQKLFGASVFTATEYQPAVYNFHISNTFSTGPPDLAPRSPLYIQLCVFKI